MKTIISMFFILSVTLSISQTKQSGIKIDLEVDALYKKVFVTLRANSNPLENCKLQILNSAKNVVKTVDLLKATNPIEINIVIPDLLPGNYTCVVYKEKEELYKKEFFMDALFIETMGMGNFRPKN